MSIEAALNSFAIRTFRDTADYDYVSARMAWRARLVPQFHWAALQAIEKYLKCILMLNRVPRVKNDRLGHNLGKALVRVEANLQFPLRLSKESREFIVHLDKFGRFRYLEISYYTRGAELIPLDRAVWELRRYCKPLTASVKLNDGSKRSLTPHLLKEIESAEVAPHSFRLIGGQLEKILTDQRHPAREALVWRNMFFGSRKRSRVQIRTYSHSTNAPLSLDPDMLDEVIKYVEIPKDVEVAFRARMTGKSRSAP